MDSINLAFQSTCVTAELAPVRVVSASGRTVGLSAGRLEIFLHERWGTVCDDSFGIEDAHVACRHLGFVEGANAYSSAGSLGYM